MTPLHYASCSQNAELTELLKKHPVEDCFKVLKQQSSQIVVIIHPYDSNVT